MDFCAHAARGAPFAYERDGAEELVTYWEDTALDYDGYPEIIYRLDIYDFDNGEELHFTQEKLEASGFGDSDTIFLTDTGNLAFHVYGSDITPQPGWVYDHSRMYSIMGGMYIFDYLMDAEFDGSKITEERFAELCDEYGLEFFRWDDAIVTYNPKEALFPYADTQNDISRLLPDNAATQSSAASTPRVHGMRPQVPSTGGGVLSREETYERPEILFLCDPIDSTYYIVIYPTSMFAPEFDQDILEAVFTAEEIKADPNSASGYVADSINRDSQVLLQLRDVKPDLDKNTDYTIFLVAENEAGFSQVWAGSFNWQEMNDEYKTALEEAQKSN